MRVQVRVQVRVQEAWGPAGKDTPLSSGLVLARALHGPGLARRPGKGRPLTGHGKEMGFSKDEEFSDHTWVYSRNPGLSFRNGDIELQTKSHFGNWCPPPPPAGP